MGGAGRVAIPLLLFDGGIDRIGTPTSRLVAGRPFWAAFRCGATPPVGLMVRVVPSLPDVTSAPDVPKNLAATAAVVAVDDEWNG